MTVATDSAKTGLPEVGPAAPTTQSITKVGTYTGTAASISTTTGFQPNLVIVKSVAATNAAMWRGDVNWHGRTDYFNATGSVGNNAIAFAEDGFSVADVASANAEVHHYFAYCDNKTGSLLQANYQGNAVSGRTFSPFGTRALAAAMIKRDSPEEAVFVFPGYAATYDGGAVTASIDSSGVLTLGNSTDINQWSAFFGEGTNIIGIPVDSQDWGAYTYTGTGATKRLPTPFPVDFAMLTPLAPVTGNTGTRLWFSSLATGEALPAGAAAKTTVNDVAGFTTNGLSVSTSNATNQSGITYGFIFAKRNRVSAIAPTSMAIKSPAVIQCDAGYINCGTAYPLSAAGHTVEWFGAMSGAPITLNGLTNAPTIDDEAGRQFPLIFASDGADRTAGSVSYGMELSAAQIYYGGADVWLGATLLIATNSNWRLRYSTDGGTSLDDYPMNTGLRYEQGLVHYVYVYQGSGKFIVYVNGVARKFRDRNLASNLSSNPAHKLYIGARKRAGATPDHASSFQFRAARLYDRPLTAEEVQQNYLSHFVGQPSPVSGFVREYLAANASGSTLTETITNTACTITNGAVLR